MSGDHNQYQKSRTSEPVGYIYEDDEGRMMFSQMPHPDSLWEPVYRNQLKGKPMTSTRKLQYYSMCHRLRGYAEGLDEDRHEALIHMLMTSAAMLEEAWDEYQATLPPEQQIGS